jgi:Iodothyronine deiodinase
MARLNELAARHRERFAFLILYSSEAHASDEWPLGTLVEIRQHRTLEERIAAAKLAAAETPIKVLVDTMTNDFEIKMGSWPERYFVVAAADKRLSFVAMPTSGTNRGFDIEELASYLDKQEHEE